MLYQITTAELRMKVIKELTKNNSQTIMNREYPTAPLTKLVLLYTAKGVNDLVFKSPTEKRNTKATAVKLKVKASSAA